MTIEEVEKSYNDETKETIYSVFKNTFLCFNKKAEKIPLKKYSKRVRKWVESIFIIGLMKLDV